MSLRIRLALAVAILAGMAVATTAFLSYASTRDRLVAEIDQSLVERSAFAVAWIQRPGALVSPTGNAPADGSLHADTALQVLAADGSVSRRPDELALPVSPTDRAHARAGGPPRTRAVTIDGVPYRLRTSALAGGGAVQVARDVSEVDRVLGALKTRFTLVGLAVVLVAIGIGWLIARRITTPIERLAVAAERVSQTGSLLADVGPQRRDETGKLTAAFTSMLGALARSREEQQRLAQDAGHELRTPLTSIRTNVEVLARHPALPDAKRAAILADLRGELGEISALVDELVRLAGDERDEEPAERVDLDALVEHSATRAERRYGREVRVEGTGRSVSARPAAVERALTNLIDNAVKFSPPDRPITIMLDGPRIAVRDHGEGIDPTEVPAVFGRFARADRARALPGSGLGLAIVRDVAESHDGSVFAHNHPDGGAVVGLVLEPMAEPGLPGLVNGRGATPSGG